MLVGAESVTASTGTKSVISSLIVNVYILLPSYCTWVYRYIREGNGNPLQYSCLENPMDGEAW